MAARKIEASDAINNSAEPAPAFPQMMAQEYTSPGTYVQSYYPSQYAQYPVPLQQPPAAISSTQHPFYYSGHPGNSWQNSVSSTSPSRMAIAYPYYSSATPGSSYQCASSSNYLPTQESWEPPKPPIAKRPSPSPTPPPKDLHRHWETTIMSFLAEIGFNQTLSALKFEFMVLNAEWERESVPEALDRLVKNIQSLGIHASDDDSEQAVAILDSRKLDYIDTSNGTKPRSQTSITKSISEFLAKNRTRNDISNRHEFLQSLTQKRRRILEETNETPGPSCARTDAKQLDRDVQMKYDIAKNEDGPLRRTMKNMDGMDSLLEAEKPSPTDKAVKRSSESILSGHSKIKSQDPDEVTPDRHPGLDGRLRNVEEHFSVRYVPSPPRSLLVRLKFLEDHIIQLEKDYPPWAALHFNQPNRGWPPPLRSTPIIVPSYLTSSQHTNTAAHLTNTSNESLPTVVGGSSKTRNTASSLHRAVLEKLEVQKAMSDLAGRNFGT